MSPGAWFGNSARPATGGGRPAVMVNGQPLSATMGQGLERMFGRIQPGSYWYDAMTGAWGPEGGPAAGWIAAGLPLPGPMPADASGGGSGRLTGVFINGRELHPTDVAALRQRLGRQPWPGRWWADASGRFGLMLGGLRLPALGPPWPWQAQPASGEPFSLASPDGKQFLGCDSDGNPFARGSNGESWFSG